MTLIDGIGDEIVQFVAVLLMVAVGALAWWSTNARPDRYRTVFVMRSRAHHPVTVSIRTRTNPMISLTPQPSPLMNDSTTETISLGTPEIVEESSRDLARVIPLQEMDSIVDADMAMMDNNRLHFYRRIDSDTGAGVGGSGTTGAGAAGAAESVADAAEEPEPPTNAQIREMDSIVSAMEADVSTRCDFFTRSNESNPTIQTNNTKVVKKENKNDLDSASVNTPTEENVVNLSSDNGNTSNEAGTDESKKILIKLKYLNDTLKEVEGSLDELLKDFKWRHFSVELSSECLVRLIYAGRVLDEAATLRACGLTHRAVVHCLVHPKRNTTQNNGNAVSTSSEAGSPQVMERAVPDRVWDLENILMTLVSVALTVVWFFRCEYSNMFTASASVALFGLTVFYSVAIFGLYLSDTFHFDRRAAQPIPNN